MKTNKPKKSILEELNESDNLEQTIKQKVVGKLINSMQKKWVLFIMASLLINLIPAIVYYAINQFFWFSLPFFVVLFFGFYSKIKSKLKDNKIKKLTAINEKKKADFKESMTKLKKMNTLFIGVISLFLFSCAPSQEEINRHNEKVKLHHAKEYLLTDRQKELNKVSSKYQIEIIIVDSCEYLYKSSYRNKAIEHKGNCRFCLIRNKTHVK